MSVKTVSSDPSLCRGPLIIPEEGRLAITGGGLSFDDAFVETRSR